MSTRFCPQCGGENDESARFCVYCREPLPEQQPVSQAVAPPPAPQPAPQPTQQFQPPQGDPYGQTQFQQPAQQFQPQQPVKKKKSPIKIILIIVGILVLGCIGTIIAVFGAASCSLNNLAAAEYYEIGGDRVPSVKTALGTEYKVTGSATKTEKGQETLDIVFETSGTAGEDMKRYASYLNDKGWLRIQDADFAQSSNPKSGLRGFQMAKNSTVAGYVVVVTLYWEPGSFNLVIDRLAGDVASETDDDLPVEPADAPSINLGGSNGGGTNPAAEDDLWAPPYFRTFNSKHYGMGLSMHSENSSSDISASMDMDVEFYVNGSRSAMVTEIFGITFRYVIDGGKQYIIDDATKQVIVSSAEDASPLPDTANMTFVSAGEDMFQGRMLYCEIWKSASGQQTKWFFDTDNEWIEGFSQTGDDGTKNEAYIAWLQVDFDESIFEIPSDYTVIQQ
jgi:hypothetical protein